MSLTNLTRPTPLKTSQDGEEDVAPPPQQREVGRSASKGRSASRPGMGQVQSPLIALAVSKGSFNNKVDELIERFGAQDGHKPPPLPEDGEPEGL